MSNFWNRFVYNYGGYFKDRIERKTNLYFPSKSEHNYLIEVFILDTKVISFWNLDNLRYEKIHFYATFNKATFLECWVMTIFVIETDRQNTICNLRYFCKLSFYSTGGFNEKRIRMRGDYAA